MINIIKTIYNNYNNKKTIIQSADSKKKLYREFFTDSSGRLHPLAKKVLIDLMEETKLFHNLSNKEDIVARERNRYILYYILSMLYDNYTEIYKELIKEDDYE